MRCSTADDGDIMARNKKSSHLPKNSPFCWYVCYGTELNIIINVFYSLFLLLLDRVVVCERGTHGIIMACNAYAYLICSRQRQKHFDLYSKTYYDDLSSRRVVVFEQWTGERSNNALFRTTAAIFLVLRLHRWLKMTMSTSTSMSKSSRIKPQKETRQFSLPPEKSSECEYVPILPSL